jgi:hypothetical protein
METFKFLRLLSNQGKEYHFSQIDYSLPIYEFEKNELIWSYRGEFSPTPKYPLPSKGKVKKGDTWTTRGLLCIEDTTKMNPPIYPINEETLKKLRNMKTYSLTTDIFIQAIIDTPGNKIESWRIMKADSPKEYLLNLIYTQDFSAAKQKLRSFLSNYYDAQLYQSDELILEICNEIKADDLLKIYHPDYVWEDLDDSENIKICDIVRDWKIFLKNCLRATERGNPYQLNKIITNNDEAEKLSSFWRNGKWNDVMGTQTDFLVFICGLYDKNCLDRSIIHGVTTLMKVCKAHDFYGVEVGDLQYHARTQSYLKLEQRKYKSLKDRLL